MGLSARCAVLALLAVGCAAATSHSSTEASTTSTTSTKHGLTTTRRSITEELENTHLTGLHDDDDDSESDESTTKSPKSTTANSVSFTLPASNTTDNDSSSEEDDSSPIPIIGMFPPSKDMLPPSKDSTSSWNTTPPSKPVGLLIIRIIETVRQPDDVVNGEPDENTSSTRRPFLRSLDSDDKTDDVTDKDDLQGSNFIYPGYFGPYPYHYPYYYRPYFGLRPHYRFW